MDEQTTPSVADHYDTLLARHYTWMLGGDLEDLATSEVQRFEALGIRAAAMAVDLGCGPGLQTLALADIGFGHVLGVDTNQQLLDELRAHARLRPAVRTLHSDLVGALPDGVGEQGIVNAVTCMGDTIVHLQDRATVGDLFSRVTAALAPSGSFVLTYRDLTKPLIGNERFLPVRSDEGKIMVCFLEFPNPDTAIVTDLIHSRTDEGWTLHKSSYPKLRLAPNWIRDQLLANGLSVTRHALGPGGVWTTVAVKPDADR